VPAAGGGSALHDASEMPMNTQAKGALQWGIVMTSSAPGELEAG
jgi:hypothetical protein